jgi:hypothetical protein
MPPLAGPTEAGREDMVVYQRIRLPVGRDECAAVTNGGEVRPWAEYGRTARPSSDWQSRVTVAEEREIS